MSTPEGIPEDHAPNADELAQCQWMAEALARAVVVPEHTLKEYPELAEQIRSNTADPTNTMVQSTSRRPRPPATDSEVETIEGHNRTAEGIRSLNAGRQAGWPEIGTKEQKTEPDHFATLNDMYNKVRGPDPQPPAPRVDAIHVRNKGYQFEVKVLIAGEWTTIHKLDTEHRDISSITNMRALIDPNIHKENSNE